MAKVVTNLSINREAGTNNNYYAVWKFSENNLDSYKVSWYYATGDEKFGDTVWFPASSSNTQSKISTYSPPENALQIKVSVKPISKNKKETKNGKSVQRSYWSGKTKSVQAYTDNYYALTNPIATLKIPPDKPSTPTLERSGYTLTASCDNFTISNSSHNNIIFKPSDWYVEFRFYKKTGTNTYKNVKNIRKTITTNPGSYHVSASYTVTNPALESLGYCVAARFYPKSIIRKQSAMSELSSVIGTPPERPLTMKVVKSSITAIKLSWKKMVAATGYVIEYSKSKAFSDGVDTSSTTITGGSNTEAIITDLEPATIYYFRIKAHNEVEDSAWSNIVDSNTYTDSSHIEEPSAPSLTINKDKKATMLFESIPEDIDLVRFELFRYDSKAKKWKLYKTSGAIAVTSLHRASYSYTVSYIGGYRVRGRYIVKFNTANKKVTYRYSIYSPYSEIVYTYPAQPKQTGISVFTDAKTVGNQEIQLSWNAVAGANEYDIQYSTQLRYFRNTDGGGTTTVSTTNASTSILITNGIEAGNTYYFRIKAKNDYNGTVKESEWSCVYPYNAGYISCIVGTVPSAPTTWSSTTTACVGDKVTLYWLHNSEDNSADRNAIIELKINGVSQTVTKTYSGNNDAYDYNDAINTRAHVINTSAFAEGTVIEWRVKTRGINNTGGENQDGYSPWSVMRTINVYATPTLSLSLMNTGHVDIPVKAQWSNTTLLSILEAGETSQQTPNPNYPQPIYGLAGYDTMTVADGVYSYSRSAGFDASVDQYYAVQITDDDGGTMWVGTTQKIAPLYEGDSIDFATGTVTRGNGRITSYNGETIHAPWLSNKDIYSAGVTPTTGATVVYPLEEPASETATLSSDLSGIYGELTLTGTGEVSVEYVNTYSVNLLADRELLKTVQLTASDNWAYIFTGLPKYDISDGHEIEYTISYQGIDEAQSVVYESTNDETNDESQLTVTNFPFAIFGDTGPNTQTPICYHISIVSDSSYEATDSIGNTIYVNAGDIVYEQFFDTTERLGIAMLPKDIDLEDGAEYTINGIVSMNSGLTATDTLSFTVDWEDVTREPNAELVLREDDYSINIRPYCLDEYDTEIEEGLTLAVYRREYDGTFKEIQTGINCGDNTYVVDPHPSLDYARYRIVAIDNLTGTISYSDLPSYPILANEIVLQWDESWSDFNADENVGDELEDEPKTGSMLMLPYNIDIADSNSVDVSLVNYIGRSHPVSYYGTQLGVTSTWNTDIPKEDKETLYALRRLMIWKGDVYVREPSGSGYWANVKVSFNQNHCDVIIPVSLDITRVEGGV